MFYCSAASPETPHAVQKLWHSLAREAWPGGDDQLLGEEPIYLLTGMLTCGIM
jgi:hypothetical protein